MTSANSAAGLRLSDYRPRQQVVLPQHAPCQARFPAIDAHTHLGRWLSDWVGRDGQWLVEDVPAWLCAMEEYNVLGFVNLDGRWGDELSANLDRFDHAFPGRFATFCHLDWSLLSQSHGTDALVESLRRSARAGAAGVKVWKDLGLHVRDTTGALVLPDDARLNAVWEAAGELNLPIWWHTADPPAFFDPADEKNESYELLLERPDWSFHGKDFPSFHRLMEALESVVSSHPRTTFVAVHVGCYAENLGWVGRMLDENPNLHIDIAARLAQLGRQPRAAKDLIERHPDRVLFGTDQIPSTGGDYATQDEYGTHYRRHFRFLETADECFPHSDEDPPLMGRWAISGLDLPDDTLRAVYSGNAERLLPRLSRTTPATTRSQTREL
jgi:predicted TIM-barrel fold metal-dependent hydrolase